jgi:preprotein translocase subunit SecA
MFEVMMMRFQEDTARHLFRMQILAPDGTPIETQEQLTALQSAAPSLPARTLDGSAQTAIHAIPTRASSTTIDALEREFERKKQRELAAARTAGGSASTTSTARRRTGDQIGRNDPCFCSSGKKYKKCHGVNA